jgi:hypothetical protein
VGTLPQAADMTAKRLIVLSLCAEIDITWRSSARRGPLTQRIRACINAADSKLSMEPRLLAAVG